MGRNLVDGVRGDDRIAVTFRNGILGDYTADRWTTYNLNVLAPGWHHLAAVGEAGQTHFYVDAEPVGSIAAQTTGPIGAVGNRGDSQCQEAFGIMSDLRIFGHPATQD